MIIGNKIFDTKNHTYIMGILNVTPDSFSDGGRWNGREEALKHAEELIDGGADILDVGGESTRPGHTQISVEEEIERVSPIIELLKSEFDIPISIDTYKSQVAESAIRAGADMVNDIWGFQYDERMADVVKKYNVSCCLMHNRNNKEYQDFLQEVCADMEVSIKIAKSVGISDDRIMLDPGVGFGKNYEHNLEILRNLNYFHQLGYPLLLGTSRKSVIGMTLDLPATEREEGTMVTTVMAVQSGYGFVRVHDAEKNRRAIQMTETILYGRR